LSLVVGSDFRVVITVVLIGCVDNCSVYFSDVVLRYVYVRLRH